MIFVYCILFLFICLVGLTFWLHHEQTLYAQALTKKLEKKIIERNKERAKTSVLETKVSNLTHKQDQHLKAISQLETEVREILEASKSIKKENKKLKTEAKSLESNLLMAIEEMTELKAKADEAKKKIEESLGRTTEVAAIRSETEILKSVSSSVRRKHLSKIRKSIKEITGTNQKIDLAEIELIKEKINQARKDLYAIQELA